MSNPQRRAPGRIYSGLLTILIVAIVAVAASALYVSAGGEVFGWTGGAFGIRERPDSVARTLQTAREAAWQSRYAEALTALDTLLAWDPEDREVVLERAKVLGWAERYGEAADALASVEDTADVETSLERARYLWWSGRAREADSLLSVVLARRPGTREAVELQDLIRPSVEPAVSVAGRWVRERPDDPFSHLWLARALVEEGRGAEALAHYRRAFGQAGTAEPEVLMEAAGVALGADSLRFAAETLSRYLHDVDPADRETRIRLARAYSWGGRYGRAEAEYRRVLAVRPDPALRLELGRMLDAAGRHDDAAAELRQVLAAAPSRQVRRDLAGALARAGRYDAALAQLVPLVDRGGESRDLRELARVLAAAKRYGDAADVLAGLIQRDPADADLRLRQARYLWWAGRLEEADAAVTALLARAPDHRAALALRTEVRAGIDPSVELAERWLALDDSPENRLRLARALVKAERPGGALAHYRALLEDRTDRELLVEALEVAEVADSLDVAAALLETRLEDDPDDADLLLRLARVHAWADRPAASARTYARYLALRPDDVEARFDRARQLAWQDSTRWEPARQELERVVAADSTHARAHALLGDLSRWQGDATAALAHYRRAAALEGDLEGVAEGMRLAMAMKEAEVTRPDATRVAWVASMDAFTDSEGFDWIASRARYHWRINEATVTATVGQGYSAGRTLMGAELGSLGFTADLGVRFALADRWNGTLSAGASTFEDVDPFLTWGAGVEYRDSTTSATARYDREPAVREAATMAALRAGAVLDRIRLSARRRAGAWTGAADLQLQRFGAPAGDATRLAGMARVDRALGAGFTVGAMVRAITADGAAPVLATEGPLYWTPDHYLAPALTLGFGRPLGSGWWLGLRAAPGWAWIDEREDGVIRYEDGDVPILEGGATVGYRRGDWSVDLSGDWGGNLDAGGYNAGSLSLQISRYGEAR